MVYPHAIETSGRRGGNKFSKRECTVQILGNLERRFKIVVIPSSNIGPRVGYSVESSTTDNVLYNIIFMYLVSQTCVVSSTPEKSVVSYSPRNTQGLHGLACDCAPRHVTGPDQYRRPQ